MLTYKIHIQYLNGLGYLNSSLLRHFMDNGHYYLLLSIHTQFNFEQIVQVLIIKHVLIYDIILFNNIIYPMFFFSKISSTRINLLY